MKGKCWHWGDLAGWWTSKPWLTWLRQRLSKGTALSKATLHSHLECILLFPCPETCSITHASPSPHSFLSSHVFLKEEPCPVLVETGCCYYYLQEKQKILILSAAQRKQWVRRREVETTPQCCHPLQPLQIPKVWEPCALSAGRETQRWGWDTVPGRTKTEPTTCSRICRQHCLCNPGLSQAVLPRLEISIWMNHGFPHIKKKKEKCFQFHRWVISVTPCSCDFSYKDAVQSDTAQSRSKLIASSAMAKRSNALRDVYSTLRDRGTCHGRQQSESYLPPCLSHNTHPSPGNNERVLLGEDLVVFCIRMPPGTVTA